jgi:hypothetical protein
LTETKCRGFLLKETLTQERSELSEREKWEGGFNAIRALISITFLTLLVLTLTAPGLSQDQVTPRITLERNGVEVDAITVNVCTQFTIEVWVRGIPDNWLLKGVSFVGTADPGQVDLIDFDVSDAEGRGWTVQIEAPTGYIKYMATPPMLITYIGDAVWLKVILHCKAPGTSEIKLTEGSFTFQILGYGEKTIVFPPEGLPVVTLTQRVPPPPPPFTTPVGGVIMSVIDTLHG